MSCTKKLCYLAAAAVNLYITFILSYKISLIGSTTHIAIWHSVRVTLLNYDTQKGSTECVGVAALYITAYTLISNNKICESERHFWIFNEITFHLLQTV